MKTTLLLALLFSVICFAQVPTGGNGTSTKYKHTANPSPAAFGYSDNLVKKVKKFESHLYVQEQSCGSVVIKTTVKYNIFDNYLKMIIKKTESKDDKICQENNKFFECLNDQNTIKMFSDLKKDPEFRPYMKVVHKMDDKEVDKLIEFYSDLQKP
jgi:hypothetical protein